LQNEVSQLRRELALSGGGKSDGPAVEEIGGVKFIGAKLDGVSGKDLPALIDTHKATIGSGVIVLIADAGGKAAVAAGVTEDLTSTISAVDLVRAAVAALGGKGGGGRPDMAQGGGTQPENAPDALKTVRKLLEGKE
jgi:alanyl-tRNA synthetase